MSDNANENGEHESESQLEKQSAGDSNGPHKDGDEGSAKADTSGAADTTAKGASREGQVELRFLIASKTAGAIIGKAGANIKRLRDAYHARIIVPDSDGPDRVVTVECVRTSVRQLLTELFQALLDDEKRSAAQSGTSASTGTSTGTGAAAAAAAAPTDAGAAPTEADARLLIHQSQAGCVIGKEGAKIKQLRSELALRVFKIFPECCPRSTERVVQMLGEPKAIVDAVLAVEELLAANPPKGTRVAYNPGMVEALQNAYGGWPLPYSGSFGGPGVPAGNHSPNGPPARRGGYAPNAARRGSARGGAGAPFRGPPQGPAGGSGPVYGGFEFYPGNSFYSQYTHNALDGGLGSTQVTLPDRLTGCIMGRGGQRIQQIRADSGAEIRIDNAQGGHDRVITIRGTSHQIQSAQFLLQQCVRKFGGIGY